MTDSPEEGGGWLAAGLQATSPFLADLCVSCLSLGPFLGAVDPWCPPQEGSSWVPGRPSEASTCLAGGLGWREARSFPS